MTEAAEMVALGRGAVVVLEQSDLGALRATGEDRLRLLHNVLTNEVASLAPGGGTRSLLLDHKGRTLADLHLLVAPEGVLLLTEADRVEATRDALDAYVIADDVELEVRPETVLSVVGPQAEAAAERLGLPLPAVAHAHAAGRLGNVAVEVTRLPLLGLPSVDLVLARDAVPAAVEALAAAGLPVADAETSRAAAEILRVEAGLPRWGHELGPDVIPLEARLAPLLHPTKGCYVGQETIVRAQARGHLNWGLWGLAPPAGAAVPEPGTEVRDGERAVGRVTSAVASPTLGRPVALARLRREVAEPGRVLRLADGAEVEVADLPFVS